ncbi:MAG: hypothetical protein WD512_01195 [Candidatus Paceibacterota bacterium]
MKLSESTIETLKNFAVITTGGVLFRPGKVQSAISTDKTTWVIANLDDDFPVEFGIWDLSQFLGLLSSLNNPSIEFEESHLIISDDDGVKSTYYYSSPEVITVPPEKEINIQDKVDFEFTLTEKVFTKLSKLAAGLQLPNLIIRNKKDKLHVTVADNSNDLSNDASIEIGDYSGPDVEVIFKIEYIKLMPDNYNVKIVAQSFGVFENEAKTRKYFISVQKQKDK